MQMIEDHSVETTGKTFTPNGTAQTLVPPPLPIASKRMA